MSEPADVISALHAMTPILERLLPRHTRLHMALEPEAAPCLIPRTTLDQIIMNLVVNARDAMPHGGEIQVSAHRAQDQLELSVRDEGVGVPPALVERIFDPFFTTKPEGEGTGMGLATVASVLRQIDGSISLESREGGGALFKCRLPLAHS